MITFQNLVTKFEQFAAEHPFVQTFTHGPASSVDLDKLETYPVMHLTYTGASYDSGVKTYSFEVYILDNPQHETEEQDYQTDVVTACELVAEDILADMQNGHDVFAFNYRYDVLSASLTPLESERSNLLTGTVLNLSLGVAWDFDSCNTPLT